MSYDSLLVNTVCVYRPIITYSKGRSTVTYPTTAHCINLPCNIQFVFGSGVAGGTREVTEHGFETVGGWWGFFKYGANIQKDDKIVDEDLSHLITPDEDLSHLITPDEDLSWLESKEEDNGRPVEDN